MSKKISTDWFVEPLDSHTNEIIAKNLAAVNKVDENVDVIDASGESHSVFQVEDHSFVTRLYKDKRKFSLNFNVYYRQGKNSKLRPWRFEENKIKKGK
jgi:hypothetical protein